MQMTTLKTILKKQLPLSVLGPLAASKIGWKSGFRRGSNAAHLANRKRLAQFDGRPLHLDQFEYRILSQNGEDGIIDAIFQVIGHKTGKMIEFGFAPTEANCLNQAISQGMDALFMDASSTACNIASSMFETLGCRSIRSIPCLITADNVNAVFRDNGFSGEIDILSIDIDSNDYWIWNAVEVVSPRLVIMEYNDRLGPDLAITIQYDPEFTFGGDSESFYEGASLAALDKLASSKGFRLIGCDSAGVNAFFMRHDTGVGKFPKVGVPEAFRYHSRSISRGLSDAARRMLIANRPFVQV
jgi:hypothetical protein